MDKKFTTVVYSTFQVEGFHAWENAPASVWFLRQQHRHIFHFKVTIEVSNDDRDIEFITLKRDCLAALPRIFDKDHSGAFHFGGKSCEMIAKDLIEWLDSEFNAKAYCVEVSEDNENGARVVYS